MTFSILLLALVPLTPLMLAMASLVPAFRPMQMQLLWLAPVPGLMAALLVPAGTVVSVPSMLLGAAISLDLMGKLFLGAISLIWLAAGFHAIRTVRERCAPFSGFWLVTLAGNLLAVVAADVVSFYLGFAMLSLAAWGLVVHSRTDAARRAGTVYIRLAILGETFLIMAMMLGAATAGSVLTADVQAALASAPDRNLAIGLLILGFGIKAGLMPLHVWLPLAHPEAPVPASAVLSGAIVKAGILGLMRFLPYEATVVEWGTILMVAGFVTAFAGAILGMMQARAKTALAYSTLSQMGLLCAALGVGLSAPLDPAGIALLFGAVALYALHHGLAKGAMFLAVDAVPAGPRWAKLLALFTALSIAGLPVSGGALAKAALKPSLMPGPIALLFTLSAITTTLLMLHAWRQMLAEKAKHDHPPRAPFLLLALAAPLATWGAGIALRIVGPMDALALENLFASAWPVAVGAALAGLAWRAGWQWPWRASAGDIVIGYEALGRRLRAAVPEQPETARQR